MCSETIRFSLKDTTEADARKRMAQRVQEHRDKAGHSRVEAMA
jgi:hypothetical protein